MSGNMENRFVSAYVFEVFCLTIGEQSCLIAVRRSMPSGDAVSSVARGLKHIEHKPLTMRTMVNESKFCVDDHNGVVYILAKYDRLPRVLSKHIIQVGDSALHVYQVKSIVWRTGSCKAFMDIPVRIKVLFF